MNSDAALGAYVLRLADNALILSQRLLELVTAGPELEEELANANFALDYLGQARMLYSLAAELHGEERDEDFYAFQRAESEFQNFLLVEQPNGHFGDVLVRQFLFESYYLQVLEALTRCQEPRLAAIAARAVKEIRYHVRHNARWIVRLGDGTDDSRDRIQASLQKIWRYTGELFAADSIDETIRNKFSGPDLAALARLWRADIAAVVDEATLQMPEDEWMAEGGKLGRHTEHFGYLLAEMQYLPRAYPGAAW